MVNVLTFLKLNNKVYTFDKKSAKDIFMLKYKSSLMKTKPLFFKGKSRKSHILNKRKTSQLPMKVLRKS